MHADAVKATARIGEKTVPVSARRVGWDEIARQSDALDPDLGWPTWHGPNGNFSATPTNHRLIRDLRQARLVWKSQERFGSGKAQSPRYGIITEDGGRLPFLVQSGRRRFQV